MDDDDQLYDEARGPRSMRRRRHYLAEWDDPTWIRVAIDQGYMDAEDLGALRYGWHPPKNADPRRGPMKQVEPSPLLTLKQAARMMSMSASSLYARMKYADGRRTYAFPFEAMKAGGAWVLWRDEVEAYVRGELLPPFGQDGDGP